MRHSGRSVLALLAAFGLWAAAPAQAESAPETIRSQVPGGKEKKTTEKEVPPDFKPAELNLKPGERLVYDVRVGGVPAGKVEQEVHRVENFGGENGPAVWVCSLDVDSNRAMSMLLYDVRNRTRSFIDVKSGCSRFYHIKRKEGDVKAEEKTSFKYDIGNMEASYERPREDGQWRQYKIPLVSKALDPLAAIYYLRSIDFKALDVGKSFYLPICTDRRLWNTRITIHERSIGDFGDLKNRPYVVIVPDAEFKGLFERKGRMKIWVDTQTGVPLKLTAEIPIGSAEVIISEHANSPLDEK